MFSYSLVQKHKTRQNRKEFYTNVVKGHTYIHAEIDHIWGTREFISCTSSKLQPTVKRQLNSLKSYLQRMETYGSYIIAIV